MSFLLRVSGARETVSGLIGFWTAVAGGICDLGSRDFEWSQRCLTISSEGRETWAARVLAPEFFGLFGSGFGWV